MEGAPAAWENGRAIPLGLRAEPAPQLPAPGPSLFPRWKAGPEKATGSLLPSRAPSSRGRAAGGAASALEIPPRSRARSPLAGSPGRSGSAGHCQPLGPATAAARGKTRACPAAGAQFRGEKGNHPPPPQHTSPTFQDRSFPSIHPHPARGPARFGLPSPRGLEPRGPYFLKSLKRTVICFSCNTLTLLILQHDTGVSLGLI